MRLLVPPLASAIDFRLLLRLGRYFDHSPNCLGTRWEVGLTAPPLIDSAEKVV
jgi:hypothetical protein